MKAHVRCWTKTQNVHIAQWHWKKNLWLTFSDSLSECRSGCKIRKIRHREKQTLKQISSPQEIFSRNETLLFYVTILIKLHLYDHGGYFFITGCLLSWMASQLQKHKIIWAASERFSGLCHKKKYFKLKWQISTSLSWSITVTVTLALSGHCTFFPHAHIHTLRVRPSCNKQRAWWWYQKDHTSEGLTSPEMSYRASSNPRKQNPTWPSDYQWTCWGDGRQHKRTRTAHHRELLLDQQHLITG